ncbi:50S ribosomal protein L16 [bacterium]|nr:50S ribosomal protein L16 [bacterium]|tara:strand:+ start:29339 stop:29758 length:420 start_codon:yes stop_codon:yes gene_type:complete
MLFPKKAKYRKWQTGRKNTAKLARPETRGVEVSFGSFGLKSMSQARITSNQIESARKVIVRTLGKTGKMWIRIFPDRPYTAKAAEVGMGKGKGDPQGYVTEVRAGRILFEVDGVPDTIAREALRKAGMKMPVKTKIVVR